MMCKRGFSLVEVLVCLMLISGTSLLLFKQQIQLKHSVRKIKLDMISLLVLDNTREQ